MLIIKLPTVRFNEEFVCNDEERQRIDQYGDLTGELHTDLHECLGHGSGKLLPGVDPDALKAYGSTIEEARADLFGLYYVARPETGGTETCSGCGGL